MKGLTALPCNCKALFQLEKHIHLLSESLYTANTLILQKKKKKNRKKTETEVINVHIPHLDTFKSTRVLKYFWTTYVYAKSYLED